MGSTQGWVTQGFPLRLLVSNVVVSQLHPQRMRLTLGTLQEIQGFLPHLFVHILNIVDSPMILQLVGVDKSAPPRTHTLAFEVEKSTTRAIGIMAITIMQFLQITEPETSRIRTQLLCTTMT